MPTALRPPATPFARFRRAATARHTAAKSAAGARQGSKAAPCCKTIGKGAARALRLAKSKPNVHSFGCIANAKVSLAAHRAICLFEEVWEVFSSSQASGCGAACVVAAQKAAVLYHQLHATAYLLLSSSGCAQTSGETDLDGTYPVLTFKGQSCKKSAGEDLTEHLASYRKSSQGCIRDALCAALACLSCRLEKVWVSDYDDEDPVRGYFVQALVDPRATFRVALRPGRHPRLASLLIVKELPLGQALEKLDDGGPLYGAGPSTKMRQYGFQKIAVHGGQGSDRRQSLKDVQSDEHLRHLIETDPKVMLLEVYCALASKELAREFALGDIIKKELVMLLQDAKLRRKAVLFQLGGSQPAMLAEKVYLQPWITDIGGLCCGYLRWRKSCDASWETMKCGQLLGLQLP